MEYGLIKNYYETLVYEEIKNSYYDNGIISDEIIDDIACLALNRLPPRYIRHSVDAEFYITDSEHEKIAQDVESAVAKAYVIVSEKPR